MAPQEDAQRCGIQVRHAKPSVDACPRNPEPKQALSGHRRWRSGAVAVIAIGFVVLGGVGSKAAPSLARVKPSCRARVVTDQRDP